jgi:hypothetical protein
MYNKPKKKREKRERKKEREKKEKKREKKRGGLNAFEEFTFVIIIIIKHYTII